MRALNVIVEGVASLFPTGVVAAISFLVQRYISRKRQRRVRRVYLSGEPDNAAELRALIDKVRTERSVHQR
jgi:hypothetical protein